MTTPGVDEAAHFTALTAVLAGSPLETLFFDVDKIPGDRGNDGTLPMTYVTPAFSREEVESTRPLVARDVSSGWILDMTSVALTVANVRDVNAWVAAELDGVRLVIDGRETTPLRAFGSTSAVAGDRGSPAQGLTSWYYAC